MRYLSLTKPGIIFGNIITFLGGYFLDFHGYFDFISFVASLVGMALVIACGCVINNFVDRDIDRLMQRTKERLCAQGLISCKFAMSYAFLLGVVGFGLLYWAGGLLTGLIALFGLFFYVVIYTLWLKRSSIHGTLVGGVSGAIPPVVGYSAYTGHLGSAALILFLILFVWQIPHSYAINIFRFEDYKAAHIPVLPVKKGLGFAKVVMLVFVIAFLLISPQLYIVGHATVLYGLIAVMLGLVWVLYCLIGFWSKNDGQWAKRIFFISIINIMVLSLAMAIF